MYLETKTKYFFHKLTHDEKGGAELVATLVIIGIVLVLAFVFRDQIAKLVGDLWNSLVRGENASGTQSSIVATWGSASSK